MNLSLQLIFTWWLVLFLFGILFLPLTSSIFNMFYDRGYIFSKVIGITLVSYIVFLLATAKILPFHFLPILFITIICSILLFILFKSSFKIENIKQKLWIIFFEELLFTAGLFFWSYIRAHDPKINGLEKFMDFGFVNSLVRSDFLPPVDMWFPPFSINYYYFGHFITALLTKFSNLPSHITYNLMLATLFAFTFSLSFSICLNLINGKDQTLKKQSLVGGILAALLISLGGNLHTIYSFFHQYNVDAPLPITHLPFSPATFPNSYWYPNATRFIPYTIHEFPIYSFVVSDLHGHVIDIPFVLLTIFVIFSIFLSQKIKVAHLLFVSFLLSILYMTNAWDGLIYLCLAFLTLFYLQYRRVQEGRISNTTNNPILQILPISIVHPFKLFLLRNFIIDLLIGLFVYLFIVILGFIIFSLPFNLNFKPFVSGIGVICAPEFLTKLEKLGPFLFEKDHCQRTLPWMLIFLYGFFYWFVFSFLVFILQNTKYLKKNYLSFLNPSDAFIIILIFLSTILILTPEFIYAKDIYPAHYRANTMFKLGYQAFMMLSITSSYVFVRILTNNLKKLIRILNLYFVFFVFSILFFALVMLYPSFAIGSFYQELKNYKGLDGIVYLKDQYPLDYEAINWLNKNIRGQPIILEAQGDSYTDFARISTNTGLPTVLGWTVHEWLWRGSYDIPSPRIQEVIDLYESKDLKKTQELIKKHHVKYVYLGDMERQKYPNLKEEKFEELGEIVYQNQTTKIYKIN